MDVLHSNVKRIDRNDQRNVNVMHTLHVEGEGDGDGDGEGEGEDTCVFKTDFECILNRHALNPNSLGLGERSKWD